MKCTIGLDFGTNSVRALLVDCRNGEELATSVFDYPSGHQGILTDPKNSHLARQNPADYLEGIEYTITTALSEAEKAIPGFNPADVIGIGVDSTGSSPIPVNAENTALACLDAFKDNPAAHCWLWKDHTSYKEAAQITEIARKERPQYVAKCGNTYSSEWWWSKLWHCLNSTPEVFDAAYSWVELADWVPAVLAGVKNPLEVKRGVCAAGHKAFYADEWGGLPDEEFLSMLDPKLAALKERLYTKAYNASETAGYLCEKWAAKLGLKAGIPLAIGEFDVHYGAIGSGIKEGTLVKAMGTSTCDCSVVKLSDDIADIPGICGIVKESILPGFYGVEAGQSAVGDLFKWWVEVVCKGEGKTHKEFRETVQQAKPGAAGLLALDWNNGNRTVLVDQRLTGLILGQTLHTSQAEIYRALIEATAYGARMIIERLEAYGVPIQTIVCCGGIAEKDPLTMQIYADVTGRTMRVSRSAQTCALGAAIGAAVVAGSGNGGYDDYDSAQAAMTGLKDMVYTPIEENHAVYNRLFKLYKDVHDAFGGVCTNDLGHVMKELLDIKETQLN
ncbi:MAG: ribulokinase [Opitutales bacterium]|nr:ribulokinase [Opitutales bacterium]